MPIMNTVDGRTFRARATAGVADTGTPPLGQPPQKPSALADPMFRPMPLGAIRPAGWLHRQLRIG